MSRALLLAWATAVDGGEQDLDQWYEDVHIPQVRSLIPSITTVTRYRLSDPASGDTGRFLAVYEMDQDDVATAAASLGGAAQAGQLDMSPALDLTVAPPETQWYRLHAPTLI